MNDIEILAVACVFLTCVSAAGWIFFFSERMLRTMSEELNDAYRREIDAARKAIVELIRERNEVLRRLEDEGDWWKESE